MSVQKVPFLEVFKDASGGNVKTPQREFLQDGEIPVVDQGQQLVAGYVNDRSRICSACPPVIVFGDHTRAIKYVDFEFAMGADGTKVLLPKIESDTKYLYYALSYIDIPAAGYSRHYKFLKETQIPLPPLDEQKRIAGILDAADALRAKRRESLAQLDTLLQATFIDMFGDPVANPMGWEKTLLGELAASKPNNGVFRKNPEYSESSDSGLPVVWVAELFRGNEIDTSNSRQLDATPNEIEKYGLRYGDILFCRSSLKLDGIAYNNVFLGKTNEALFECHLIRFSPEIEVVAPMFLNLQLRSGPMRALLKLKSKTATMTTIDQKALSSVEVIVPPLDLQHRFTAFAKSIEKQKTSQRAHLAELDTLFASLQQRAFNGELSLV